MPEMLQLGGGVAVVKPDDGTVLRYSPNEVDMVRAFFSMLVFGQNEWAGKPFELSGWEERLSASFTVSRPRMRTGAGAGTGASSMRRSPRRMARASLQPAWASTT